MSKINELSIYNNLEVPLGLFAIELSRKFNNKELLKIVEENKKNCPKEYLKDNDSYGTQGDCAWGEELWKERILAIKNLTFSNVEEKYGITDENIKLSCLYSEIYWFALYIRTGEDLIKIKIKEIIGHKSKIDVLKKQLYKSRNFLGIFYGIIYFIILFYFSKEIEHNGYLLLLMSVFHPIPAILIIDHYVIRKICNS